MAAPHCPSSLPIYLKEDIISQECKDLISSLPTGTGCVVLKLLHQYQGFWHTARQLQAVLTCQEHFQAQHDDVLLVTTPKSGTTWLKALIFALINRDRYPDAQTHPLITNNPHILVPFLERQMYIDNQVPDFTNFTSPRLFSTHLPVGSLPESVKLSSCKLVYLCRNPKDTLVSIWHFSNKLAVEGTNSLEETFDKFCRGMNLYGPFWDHVLQYWKESLENPKRVFFLRYEEMKEQPTVQLKRLADFLGCPLSDQEETSGVVGNIVKLCSFDNLSSLEVNQNGRLRSGEECRAYFRRGEVGDWMNYLTPEMGETLDRITEQKFLGSGLKL